MKSDERLWSRVRLAYVQVCRVGGLHGVPDELVAGLHFQVGLAIGDEGRQKFDEALRKDQIFVRQRPEGSGQDREQVNQVVAVADPELHALLNDLDNDQMS